MNYSYDPRTIAFLCELFHPPRELDPKAIQKVHNDLFSTRDPAYKSFAVTPLGAVLSNPVTGPGATSMVTFLADRIQFREELGGITVEDFALRVENIAARVAPPTGIQVFTAQQVTIRSLVNPRHFEDSRSYLKYGMFGFDEETDAFGRDAQLLGMRMVFPPNASEPNQHALRIESFASDARSLFVENQASYPPTLVARGFDPLAANVQATYDFLVERALTFAEAFDAPLGT